MSKTQPSLSLRKYDWFKKTTPTSEDDDIIDGIFCLTLS